MKRRKTTGIFQRVPLMPRPGFEPGTSRTWVQRSSKRAIKAWLCKFEKNSTKYHLILDSKEVSIPACHAGDRGSIPRRGGVLFFENCWTIKICSVLKNLEVTTLKIRQVPKIFWLPLPKSNFLYWSLTSPTLKVYFFNKILSSFSKP